MGGEAETLLARVRPILGRGGLDVDVADYRGLGVPGTATPATRS